MLRGSKESLLANLTQWSFRSEEKVNIRTNKSVDEVQKMTFIDIPVVHFLLCSPLWFHATKILVNFTINEYLVGYCKRFGNYF